MFFNFSGTQTLGINDPEWDISFAVLKIGNARKSTGNDSLCKKMYVQKYVPIWAEIYVKKIDEKS